MFDLEEIILKVKKAPLLSQSTSLLIDLMAKPDRSIQDITRIVECDGILTAKVLEVANSTTFSPMQPITSVNRAISYLGTRMVVGIALSTCAEAVYNEDMSGYESERGKLWKHSLMTAIASRKIAQFSKDDVSPDVAYTGGILHDIGKSIISEFLIGSAKNIVRKIDSEEIEDYLCAENETVGIDHCSIGLKLAKHWNLPVPLQAAILNHHTPDSAECEYCALAYVVHLGDTIAMMEGSGTGADSMRYQLDTKYEKYIDISPDILTKIMLEVKSEFKNTASSLT